MQLFVYTNIIFGETFVSLLLTNDIRFIGIFMRYVTLYMPVNDIITLSLETH